MNEPDIQRRTPHRAGVLPEATRTALHDAMLACMAAADGHRISADRLRQCARAARDSGVKPEHVVALIRNLWYERRPPVVLGTDHDLRLTQIIAMALDGYFAGEEPPHAGLPGRSD